MPSNNDETQLHRSGNAHYSHGEETTVAVPSRIGRFAIHSILGRGGFGVVYLATDEQLQR